MAGLGKKVLEPVGKPRPAPLEIPAEGNTVIAAQDTFVATASTERAAASSQPAACALVGRAQGASGGAFDRLPDEVVAIVLQHLEPREFWSVAPLVCRRWNAVKLQWCRVALDLKGLAPSVDKGELQRRWGEQSDCGAPARNAPLWGSLAAQTFMARFIPAGSLERAARVHSISELHLAGCTSITVQEIVRTLTRHADVRVLDLSRRSMADTDLSSLAPHLGAIRELRMDENALSSDAIVAAVRHCPKLRVLDVNGTALTDAGIEQLAQACPLLSRVRVRRTQVTCAGADAARSQRPLLKVALLAPKSKRNGGARALGSG